MIARIRLLRNVGTFDSVAAGAAIALTRLNVIYAENGRGKTTLAAVLRSLATGDPVPISERRRLAAQHPPHIVVECDDAPHAIFENGAWTRMRHAMERIIGRSLLEDEAIAIIVYRPAPTGPAREEAGRRLSERIDKTAQRAKGVPEKEIDAAIDEAPDHVRHHSE